MAFHAIPDPHKLSLSTALHLFSLKIDPTAAYGVQVVWPYLTPGNFDELDRVKAAFLKRVMGIHRSSRNRLVYLAAGTPLFTEDLQKRFNLPKTPTFISHLQRWELKLAEIDPEFNLTRAMLSDDWKGPLQANRHLLLRFAMHGFHHQICQTAGFHEADNGCKCRLCGQKCSTYHLQRCLRAVPLSTFT